MSELVVRRPEIVVEGAEALAVPVQAVEVDVGGAVAVAAAGGADEAQELEEPCHTGGGGGDGGGADAEVVGWKAEGGDVLEPDGRRMLRGHVGLGGEVRLVEGEEVRGVRIEGLVVEMLGIDVVPLHRGEGEGRGEGGLGRPVVEPGDFGGRSGEEMGGGGGGGGPGEAAFGG